MARDIQARKERGVYKSKRQGWKGEAYMVILFYKWNLQGGYHYDYNGWNFYRYGSQRLYFFISHV
jgi:hypothetical protein